MNEVMIIDDVLPSIIADEIERSLFSEKFPWYFLEDITNPDWASDSENNTIGFCHYFLNDSITTSNHYNIVSLIAKFALNKANINDDYNVVKARSFLHVAQPNKREHDSIHVDMNTDHLVVLYYVNNTDGDTFIFGDGRYDSVTQRISPKKNRVIIFDGSIYHASSAPTVGKRCIINFNLIK